MNAATDAPKTAAKDDTPAPAGDGTHEIRGMMPSFHVWHRAQHTLAVERAVVTRARDDDAPKKRRRWPLVVAALAIVAVALGLERGGGSQLMNVTATTPVELLPWRNVDAPSGAFHVSLPDKPQAREVDTVAGSGDQLEVRIQQTGITVSAYAENGPSQGRELVRPILEERAAALNGRVDNLRAVDSRAGEAFEAFVRTTTAVAVVRVIVDGAMLYIVEIRGDVESPHTRQIYDKVVLSFTAGT
ncbi:MAG: hypothetical protein ABI658_11605 [Acidimicrobiales bacterium]